MGRCIPVHLKGKGTVVGDHDQPFAHEVKAANRVDARREVIQQIKYGRAPLRIIRRTNHLRRFVQQEGDRGFLGDNFAIADVLLRGRIDFGSEFDDGFAVGQALTIVGTTDNNGSYTIEDISADGRVLTLGTYDTLSDATGVQVADLQAGDLTEAAFQSTAANPLPRCAGTVSTWGMVTTPSCSW